MKRLFALIAALFVAASALMAQTDGRFDALKAKLDEYFVSLSGEKTDVVNRECDFIIESCQDPDVRQWVALYVYDHYLSSSVMGEEAVAVHVAEEWFLSGKVPMKSDMDLMNARIFVEFNKSSLIGNDAPVLTLRDSEGRPVRVPAEKAYSLLYFYDTSCSTCRLESARLKNYLSDSGFPLEFFAVYTGTDEAAWGRYRAQNLNVEGARHLWDPEMDSDYQLKYGVLQTPQMLLVGPDGKILGRKLDTAALGVLLSWVSADKDYVYGDKFQMDFYSALFAEYGDSLSAGSVDEIASYIASRTLAEGLNEEYKQMEGDLLYFLYTNRNEQLKAGTLPFIDKYILGVPGIWTEPADTANVLSLAMMMKGLLELTPVGEPVPDVAVPGVLRRRPCLFRKGSKSGVFKLRKLGKSYVVFYSEGCGSCQETLDAVDVLIAGDRRAKVLLVNVDSIMEEDPELGHLLLEDFDLSSLPLVLKLGRKGIVERKYVDL